MFYYCRLCAELKRTDEVLDFNFLDKEDEKCKEILEKLTFLNASYVNVDRFGLHRTVCLDCDDSLTKAYEFLLKVKNAQEKFVGLFEPGKKTEEQTRKPEEDKKVLRNIKHEVFFEVDDAPCQDDGSNLKFSKRVANIVVEVDPTECHNDGENAQNIKTEPYSSTSSNAPAKDPLPMIESWSEYRWTCGICLAEQPDVVALRAHSIREHTKCAEYACFDCQKVLDFNAFVSHVKGHHRNLRNRCHYCDAVIERPHLHAHIDEHVRPLSCCNACGMTFPDDSTLQKHLDSVIKKIKPKKGRSTKTPEINRTCPVCGKIFKHPSLLKKHTPIHDSERKREFACDQCGSMFYNKNDLKQHFTMHTGERLHVCTVCNRSFRQSGSMREHMKIHTNTKPFSCDTCGRRFVRRSQLETHKVRHTDLCPFICQYCDKRFHFKQCLVKHERQHTGVKPYTCDECHRTFAEWGNLNKHMKRRHNRDLSKRKKQDSSLSDALNVGGAMNVNEMNVN